MPGRFEPVVAGQLKASNRNILFTYDDAYLERVRDERAISIYEPELPLFAGTLPLPDGLAMPGCIRDAAPDAWGRRVIRHKLLGPERAESDDPSLLSELTYLLESGSDRIGALDFQVSPTEYVPRCVDHASLEELADSIEKVEKGLPIHTELDRGLIFGCAVGGAHPKALTERDDTKFVAKFGSPAVSHNVVKAEFVAMRLASIVGLNVAPVQLTAVRNMDVLLVERFDRLPRNGDWSRKLVVSALTLFELDELMARYASYEAFAEIVGRRFTLPADSLRELFSRVVFNILCGNTDDHARNHAAFWHGDTLELTPAYDICSQNRTGGEASQAMLILGNKRLSRVSTCLKAADHFGLSREEAIEMVAGQISCLVENWEGVCNEANFSLAERAGYWGRQFLNPFAFDDLRGDASLLKAHASDARAALPSA